MTKQPSNLEFGTLKDYQMTGLNWLISLNEMNVNGILADQMGLGKTIQTIALLAYLVESKGLRGKFLIVSPKSVIGNWHRELRRWLPRTKSIRLMAKKEDFNANMEVYVRRRNFEVLLTTYEGVNKAIRELRGIQWEYVIVDEAHCLKNENGQLSEHLRALRTRHKLLITGTPIQNNVQELWALLNFNMPAMFDDKRVFENPENGRRSSAEQTENRNLEFIQLVHTVVNPFLLKRSKKDLDLKLPPKKEFQIHVTMTNLQLSLYKRILLRQPIHGVNPNSSNVLMQLRKCCNHPYLFDGVEPENADPCGEHLVQTSSKMAVVDRLLAKLQGRHQVLIFSQFSSMLDILEDFMRMRGYAYSRIDGKTSFEGRERAIDEFTCANSRKFVFLLSTRAGGLGINLMTADTVIIYDSDWNPQMDLQAMGRADRIGQKNAVNVYRLICDKTIEEKIIERQQIKLKWDQLVILKGRVTQKQGKISKEEMKDLVCHGSEAIFKMSSQSHRKDDLEAILKRGEQRTIQLQKRVEDIVNRTRDKALNLAVESINVFDLVKNEIYSEDSEHSKRIRKIWQESGGQKNTSTRKGGSAIVDFHYFADQNRMLQLTRKKSLSPSERLEKKAILQESFGEWTQTHFDRFLESIEQNGEVDVERVAEELAKTKEEVARMQKRFWGELVYLKNHKAIVDRFCRAQKERRERLRARRALSEKGGRAGSFREIRLGSEFYNKSKSVQIPGILDKFLIFEMARDKGPKKGSEVISKIENECSFKHSPFLRGLTATMVDQRMSELSRMVRDEFDYALKYKEEIQKKGQSEWVKGKADPTGWGFTRLLEKDFADVEGEDIDYVERLRQSDVKRRRPESKRPRRRTRKRLKTRTFFNGKYYQKMREWRSHMEEKKKREELIEEVEDLESVSHDKPEAKDSSSANSEDSSSPFKGISEFVKIRRSPSSSSKKPKPLIGKREALPVEAESAPKKVHLISKEINMDVLLFNNNADNLKRQMDLKRVSTMARDTSNLKSYFEKMYLAINALLEDIREEGFTIGKAQKQAIEAEIDVKLEKLLNRINQSKASKELEKEINLCRLKAESEFYLLEKNKKLEQEKTVFLHFLNECARRLPKAKQFILENHKNTDLSSLVEELVQAKEVNQDYELIKYIFSIKNQLWRRKYINKLFRKGIKAKRGFGFRRHDQGV